MALWSVQYGVKQIKVMHIISLISPGMGDAEKGDYIITDTEKSDSNHY